MKKLDFDLKLRLNGKRIYPTKSVKYLGIKIDENNDTKANFQDTNLATYFQKKQGRGGKGKGMPMPPPPPVRQRTCIANKKR